MEDYPKERTVIGLSDIERMISLVLFSAYIKGEKPLSLLIISKVESGKTQLLENFAGNRGVAWVTDATAWGIAKHYKNRLETGAVKHLLFPEFTIPLSRSYETVEMFDSFLCGLVEEGIGSLVSFRWDVEVKVPFGCGVIICISGQEFKAKEKRWFRVGLMSRLIPVSYDYQAKTRRLVMHYVKTRRYAVEDKIRLDFPKNPVAIRLPLEIANKIEELTEALVVGTEFYGFRWQRHLQRLAMANALMEGRDMVTNEDFEVVKYLKQYMNKDCRTRI